MVSVSTGHQGLSSRRRMGLPSQNQRQNSDRGWCREVHTWKTNPSVSDGKSRGPGLVVGRTGLAAPFSPRVEFLRRGMSRLYCSEVVRRFGLKHLLGVGMAGNRILCNCLHS